MSPQLISMLPVMKVTRSGISPALNWVPSALSGATRVLVAMLFMLATSIVSVQGQSPDPDSPRYKGVTGLRDFFGTTGSESLEVPQARRCSLDHEHSQDRHGWRRRS